MDGILYDLTEEIKLEKNKKHSIELVVDRLVLKEGLRRRLADSIETACNHSGGLVVISLPGTGEDFSALRKNLRDSYNLLNRKGK